MYLVLSTTKQCEVFISLCDLKLERYISLCHDRDNITFPRIGFINVHEERFDWDAWTRASLLSLFTTMSYNSLSLSPRGGWVSVGGLLVCVCGRRPSHAPSNQQRGERLHHQLHRGSGEHFLLTFFRLFIPTTWLEMTKDVIVWKMRTWKNEVLCFTAASSLLLPHETLSMLDRNEPVSLSLMTRLHPAVCETGVLD